MKIRMFFLVLGMFVVSCSSIPQREALKIEPGMSKEQVTAIAGPPLDRSFVGTQERWIYGGEKGEGDKKIVVFRSGKVVSLETEAAGAAPAVGTGPTAGSSVIPATGPIPDLPCADKNSYGSFAEGGGCNMYGCWPPGGYCNSFGCSAQGTCTVKRCPRPIETYRCVE